MEYPFPSTYDRNKSLAAAQQAVAAAHSRGLSSSHPSAQPSAHHPHLIHRGLLPGRHPYEGLSVEESAPKRPRLFPESKPSHLQPLHIHTGDMVDMGKKVSQ